MTLTIMVTATTGCVMAGEVQEGSTKDRYKSRFPDD